MTFDATWRAASRIEPCSVALVDAFIAAHYLHKRPAVVVLALRMIAHERAVGTCVFSLPPRETAKRYGGGVAWELARLYLLDEVPKNAETWFIGRAVRWIKRHRPDVSTLVSYADPSAGHRGTIYRAANWTADGRTDDERKTPRFDLVDAETGKKYGRASHVPAGRATTRLPRVSKLRFVLRLREPTGSEPSETASSPSAPEPRSSNSG